MGQPPAPAAAVRAERGEPVDLDTLAGCDGEQVAQALLTLADVQRLVAALPREQRAALMLVAVDGRSTPKRPGCWACRRAPSPAMARARLALAEAFEVSNDRAPAPSRHS